MFLSFSYWCVRYMWDIYGPCSYHCCSVAKSYVTLLPLWTAACRILWPSLSFRICSDLCPLSQWCYLTISSSAAPFSSWPQSFPESGFFFQWIGSLHQLAKVLELQLPHQSFQWTWGLISLRIDWFGFLLVQGILKSLVQHHSSKASITWCSVFFMVQLSHLCVTTGKNIALTLQTFVNKEMSLVFNMLSRCVIAFLPRSKHLLISW